MSGLIIKHRIFSALFLVIGLVLLTLPAKVESKEAKEWFIKQTSPSLGLVFSDISKDAVRIRTSGVKGKLSPITIIVRAPGWKAIIFNEDSKRYTELLPEQWKKRAIFQLQAEAGKVNANAKMKTVTIHSRSETIAGCPTIAYMLTTASNNSSQLTSRQSEIWISSKIKVPSVLENFFCSIFALPDFEGFPLRISQNSELGQKLLLDTLYIDYRKLDRAAFSHQLKEYKKLESVVQVMLGKRVEDLEEFIGNPP